MVTFTGHEGYCFCPTNAIGTVWHLNFNRKSKFFRTVCDRRLKWDQFWPRSRNDAHEAFGLQAHHEAVTIPVWHALIIMEMA